jgi:haloacetate dehalogenase
VAADLRGYGDSSKLPSGGDHINYSKHEMAKDQVSVMRALGHSRFILAGHDRGGRLAHRLVLDHPDAVSHLVLLNIVSTAQTYAGTDKALATSQFWWFFLVQPEPLPEHMINGDREFFLRSHLDHLLKTPGAMEPEAFAEYLLLRQRGPRYHHARDCRNAGTGKLPRGEYPNDSAVMVGSRSGTRAGRV